MRRAAILSLLLLAGGPGFATAQSAALAQLRFEQLAGEEGLAQSIVRAILQDHRGFLWFATQDGLHLYDGYRIVRFTHDVGNPDSIPTNIVTALAETRGATGATLWIGTSEGLAAYDSAAHRFTRYRHDPADPTTLSSNSVRVLHADRAGRLWVGTSNGLNRFDPRTGTSARYGARANDPHSLTHNFISAIAETPDGALWVGTGQGLNRLDPQTDRFTRYVHRPGDARSLNHDQIRSLYVDRHGRLWVGTDAGGLDRYEPEIDGFVHHVHSSAPGSLSGNSVNAVVEDEDGDLWIGVWGGGINRLLPPDSEAHESAPQFVAYRHDPVDRHSLPIDDVNVMLRDRTGLIWVGTYGGGISRFNPANLRRAGHYKHRANDPASIVDSRVYAIAVDRSGTLWVGTWGGLSRLRRGAERFERFPVVARDGHGLTDLRVSSITEGRDGSIWVATLDGGLNRIDPVTDRVMAYRHISSRPDSLSGDRLTATHVGRDGTLWVGTLAQGLNRFDAARGTFTRYMHDPADDGTLSDNHIDAIHEDRAGRLWLATNTGVNTLDPRTGRVTRIAAAPWAPPALRSVITAFAEGADGTLWVGTATAGLVAISGYGTERVATREFRQGEGLPNDHVYAIELDQRGHVWVSTNAGIARLDPHTGGILAFDVTDGLQGNEFRDGSYYDAARDLLYFGGSNGFNVFSPLTLPRRPVPAPVALTAFRVQNVELRPGVDALLPRHIADLEAVSLRYADQVFSIEFAGLNFAAPGKLQYAYQLQGFDADWNHTDSSRRLATYTNLAPGKYVFRVRASMDGTTWGEPRQLAVTILPPYWMTWWFRTATAVGVVFAVVAVHLLRVRRIERQRRILEAEIGARTRELQREKEKVTAALREAEFANAAKSTFLAHISHEIRTPLNAVVGMTSMLQETRLDAHQRQYADALKTGGEALSELLNDTLDLAKLEVGRFELDPVPFDVRRLVRDVATLAGVSAREKGLLLTWSVADDVPSMVVGDAGAVRRILLNLAANAVKFTESGSVDVSVKRLADPAGLLQFAVRDTGIGIAREKQAMIFEAFSQADPSIAHRFGGTGLGLTICRELAALMGGRAWVESEPGLGSTFYVTAALPVAASVAGAGNDDAARGEESVPLQPLRILLVDDAAQNRMLVLAYLKTLPDAVDVAENGRVAVEKIRTNKYDVVLMDVHMPEMDGYTATRTIREWEAESGRPRTPIIALTAHAFAEDIDKSVEAGCDSHLAKPLKRSVLLDTLARYRRN